MTRLLWLTDIPEQQRGRSTERAVEKPENSIHILQLLSQTMLLHKFAPRPLNLRLLRPMHSLEFAPSDPFWAIPSWIEATLGFGILVTILWTFRLDPVPSGDSRPPLLPCKCTVITSVVFLVRGTHKDRPFFLVGVPANRELDLAEIEAYLHLGC